MYLIDKTMGTIFFKTQTPPAGAFGTGRLHRSTQTYSCNQTCPPPSVPERADDQVGITPMNTKAATDCRNLHKRDFA